MSRHQVQVDGKLEAIESEAAEELGAARQRGGGSRRGTDAEEAVEVAVEVARQRLEEAVESREDAQALSGPTRSSTSCADAGRRWDTPIAERSAYERGCAVFQVPGAAEEPARRRRSSARGRRHMQRCAGVGGAEEAAEVRGGLGALAAALSDAADGAPLRETALEARGGG